MMRARQKAAIALVLLAALATGVGRAGSPGPVGRPASGTKFLEVRVPEFEVRDQTLVDAMWKLARAPAPFPFGFEHVLKRRLSGPDVPETRFSLRLENRSIRQVLDALCAADPRFTWAMDGSVVNVFPRSVIGDPSYLLNRRFKSLELRNATDAQDGLLAIVRQLPPPVEQIAQAQVGGADPYPRQPWTVTFHDLTVRQVVNRLALHGGPCGTWVFGGSRDFRAFGFFNTYACGKLPPRWVRGMTESHPVSRHP